MDTSQKRSGTLNGDTFSESVPVIFVPHYFFNDQVYFVTPRFHETGLHTFWLYPSIKRILGPPLLQSVVEFDDTLSFHGTDREHWYFFTN
ncbi:hypothetical protein BMS3Bbin04_00773 [bacterium BMS3Bbin04]|nr:hypothetical protein BMS3Bbin04_00773 [bacterium BMS3Bbin04]